MKHDPQIKVGSERKEQTVYGIGSFRVRRSVSRPHFPILGARHKRGNARQIDGEFRG